MDGHVIVWNGLERCPPGTAAAASLGNYDGVHLGHQAIVRRVVASARQRDAMAVVITFEPHPLAVLSPHRRPRLLQTRRQKLRALEECGLDAVLFLRFDAFMAERSGEAFIDSILVGGLRLTAVHVGTGFRFGSDREGDLAMLRRLGEGRDFEVEGVPEVLVDGEVVSSTRIRAVLEAGEVGSAHRMLGRPFAATGEIVRGEGRGSKLNFPTANLEVENEMVPRPGVYVTETRVLASRVPSVTNVGVRPTFGGTSLSVETHLIDFDGDLYGQRAEVLFLDRLRDERAFDGPGALADQIGRDRADAVSYFRRLSMASP